MKKPSPNKVYWQVFWARFSDKFRKGEHHYTLWQCHKIAKGCMAVRKYEIKKGIKDWKK